MRYIGGVLSSVEPETTSTSASGVFTLNDYAQKVSATNLPTPKLGIQFIMVGGGGSGGPGNTSQGGGGGAGGVLECTDFSFKITRGVTYTIVIGAGGTGEDYFASPGSNTTAFGLVALGGGQGGVGYYASFAGNGGSGGGTGVTHERGGRSIQEVPSNVGNITAFGNHGGGYYGRPNVAPINGNIGGGGGAGEQGNTDGLYQGGDGKSNTTFLKADGVTYYGENGIYAGGGGGGVECTTANVTNNTFGGGGVGGGGFSTYKLNMGFGTAGNTGAIFDYHSDGLPNTGGGGGGDRFPSNASYESVGNGGSGIVIVRYPDNFPAAVVTGSPEIVNASGHRQYAFLASGTFKVD